MDLLTISVENGPVKTTHFHKEIELIMVLEGNLTVGIEDEKYELQEEDCILINSNCHHSCETGKECCFLRLSLSYEEICRLLSHSVVEFQCNSVTENSLKYEELEILLRKLLNISFQKNEKELLQYHTLSYQCVDLLVDKFMAYMGDNAEETADSDENRYMEIINYIRSHYRSDISLQDLADKLHLSVSYLSRYIKEALGCNFVQYLNQIRLEHAVEDLLESDAVITRIAYDNGFPNIAAFNKKFKEVYGETPSVYRRKKREDEKVKTEREDAGRLLTKVEEYLQQHPEQTVNEQENQHIPVRVNIQDKRELNKNWNQVINIGSARDLLMSSIQEHVLILKKELGFKPKQIIKNIEESEVEVESEIPVEDIESLRELMESFMEHLIQRYGEQEVDTWYFENWGDKRLFTGDSAFTYFDVFNTVYEVVKSYAPAANVGGAGVSINDSQCRRLESRLEEWKQYGKSPDFLSVYLYPYMRSGKGASKYIRQATETSFLADQLKCARKVIQNAGFSSCQLHVTEWNLTLSNRNYINDSCFKAAYLARALTEMTELADKVVYFVGSDLFSEFYDTDKILYGGAGLISQDGIRKPAFYAFRYMNRLGGQLLYADSHCIITSDDKMGYRIVCFNCGKINYQYFMKKEEQVEGAQLDKYFEEEEKTVLHILLDGVDNGNYKIKARRLNTSFGSVLDEWKHIDMDENLDADDIQYLKQICVPRHSLQYTSTTSRLLNIKVELEVQELQYIHVEYTGTGQNKK